MTTQFVFIRDFNFKGDNQFGIYMEDVNLYAFGDGDMYTPEQIRKGAMGTEVEWLSWVQVEALLAGAL